jgi:hypothetical protein
MGISSATVGSVASSGQQVGANIQSNPTGPTKWTPPATASGTVGCRGYWLTWDVDDDGNGNWVGSQDLNTGWCGDSTNVWVNWGPDCNYHNATAYYGGHDSGGWCGIFKNDTPNPESGVNWYVSPYTTPFYKRWGYQRQHMYVSGAYNWYGYCCN